MTTEPITVRVGEAIAEAAPDLWGLFIEDLNDALDGGLNAERVRNGDFEFTAADRDGWHALTSWTTEGAVEVRTDDPVHANNLHYVRLSGPTVLENEGWDGIRAAKGDRLRFTCFARAHGKAAYVGVAVEAGLARAEFTAAHGGWRRVEVDLVAYADGDGPLRVVVHSDAIVDIDCVSVRPVGAGGEPLTFRPDLLQALKDLSPSFIRFPGGCVAHGFGLANIYHWKDTIGPRHERVQVRNIWGYHQSRQIGYVEYFELCQATGATAVPVVAAGVCCQNSPGGQHAIPEDEMDDYIQDVLDLGEFANGPVATPWGAKRAALGHPEPFGLRYLGIGNEDQITDDFRDRYARIEDAVRKAYPEITVIGTVGPQTYGPEYEAGWVYARERGIAMVDEHGYQNPRWLHQNVDRYTAYDPAETKVYLGEYAGCTSMVRSALAEAAYMIGLERRPEVVRLASYAPLLARVGHTQWTPDLIYFTADEVRPSASYYVQQAFATERGQRVHLVALEGVEHEPVTLPREGTAHLLPRGAAVAFTDVVLDGRRLPDAHVGPDSDVVLLGGIDPTHADLEFTAVRHDGVEGFAVRLGPEAPQSFLKFYFGTGANNSTLIIRSDDGIDNVDHGPLPWAGVRTGEPVHVRVRLDGPRAWVWVDGDLRHEYEQDMRPEQRLVAGALSRTGADGRPEYVVRMVNAMPTARAARVALEHLPGAVTAAIRVLAGAGPDEGVSHQASPVTPVQATASGEDGIDLDLPPWSFVTAVIGQAA